MRRARITLGRHTRIQGFGIIFVALGFQHTAVTGPKIQTFLLGQHLAAATAARFGSGATVIIGSVGIVKYPLVNIGVDTCQITKISKSMLRKCEVYQSKQMHDNNLPQFPSTTWVIPKSTAVVIIAMVSSSIKPYVSINQLRVLMKQSSMAMSKEAP